MKKKIWIPIVVIALILILFLPIPSGTAPDDGTRTFTALTYKIVDWHRFHCNGEFYYDTNVYFFPNNFKSIDELWQLEKDKMYREFRATIVELNGDSVIVEAIDYGYDRMVFSTKDLDDIGVNVGDIVYITFNGLVMETYPVQITVKGWRKVSGDYVPLNISEWMGGESIESAHPEYYFFGKVKDVRSDCLIVSYFHYNEQKRYDIKLNGDVGDWCVGDQVEFDFENAYIDRENYRIEADLVEINQALVDAKPVIYLYPETETKVSVTLNYNGKLTCTYPAYNNGWTVTASPDGTLTDANGQTYNYLYWEGETSVKYDMSSGFCVKGEDTVQFLESALSSLGLSRREANEFIVYWLPLMECNPYNVISFQTAVYADSAKLEINPAPDTLIRVFMAWQSCDEFVELVPQTLTAPERVGFTVVEWGGTEVKN